MNADVLIVGAGGLGCPAAIALAAGGARRIAVVDDDSVDESNLPRQILYRAGDAGARKAAAFARGLERRFPGVAVVAHDAHFDAASAARLLREADVVLDASDNFATKFLANDAAVLADRPLVHGAAVGLGGQLLTVPRGGRPCYRCLFEELPPAGAGPSCAEAGVLGPVPGVIGALMAAEALRILGGEIPAFAGRLLQYDSAAMTFRTVRLRQNPLCGVCGPQAGIRSLDPARYAVEECRP